MENFPREGRLRTFAPKMTAAKRGTVLLVGGGTGGHIYPNVGIVERLAARGHDAHHFLVSDRPSDAKILDALSYPYTSSPARPLPSARKPWKALDFLAGWRRSTRQLMALLDRESVRCVVATGGFVSGPAVVAAARRKIPRVLVNLDAVPGQANRRLAGICTKVFSAYPSDLLPDAERIGLPLRAVSVTDLSAEAARASLQLEPDRPTLFITGATHGAESLIKAMMAFIDSPERASAFEGWQVFHQCGTFDVATLQAAYDDAGITARVVDYTNAMGAAYRASTLVISRAGAGSVAEAWANHAPTLFLPNPYHKDQHQRHNAEPMVQAGGALLVTDHVDAPATANALEEPLLRLLREEDARAAMAQAAAQSCPPDGAETVAAWIADNA